VRLFRAAANGAGRLGLSAGALLFDDVLAHVAEYTRRRSRDERRRSIRWRSNGMLDQLHDPYSVFLKPDDFRQLSEEHEPAITPASASRSTCATRDHRRRATADTPAERGRHPRQADRIVAARWPLDGGWKQDQAVKELRGPAGTTAELQIRRSGVGQTDHLQTDARDDSHPLGRPAHHDDAQRSRRLHRAVPRERELDAGRGAGDRHADQAGDEVADL